MTKITTDILIVGGGAAGMSAAVAASEKASVTIVDDNPHLGGQIWRAELGKTRSSEAKGLISAIDGKQVRIINNAQVFGSNNNGALLVETSNGQLELGFEKLIIATGARERFIPFPGWTLPGVFGAGGLQAMVKGGMSVNDKRIVVAGTGPLLLAVADYLKAKGANVLMIAEQTSAAKVRRFARGLWRQPAKMMNAAALRARLVGIPYLTDSWVTSAQCELSVQKPARSKGETKALLSVSLSQKTKTRTIDCDYLACGFHLVPSTELAQLLGCEIQNGKVSVNEFQQTSTDNIYCAGEPTGIAGVESSLIEGNIAGLAATGQLDAARSLFRPRDKAAKFGEALNTTFALRDELRKLADAETIVCRCEDVSFKRLIEFDNFRDAKLQTRCGMGPCQARICGAATEFLFGWELPNVRLPIFPVKMENL